MIRSPRSQLACWYCMYFLPVAVLGGAVSVHLNSLVVEISVPAHWVSVSCTHVLWKDGTFAIVQMTAKMHTMR